MSRLLFAAARGARIELHIPDLMWRVTNQMPVTTVRKNYRIHPKDAHLQYGPISSELRELSKIPPMLIDQTGVIASVFISRHKNADELYMHADELHRSLFLLTLAEALADEGL